MKRRTFGALTLGSALAAVTGCGSDSSSSDSNTFEFWAFTGIDEQTIVDTYLATHPDITIKLTEVGSSTETAQAITTALAGGKVPDLALIQGDDLPNFVEQPQNFVDLTTLGANDLESDFLDWVWTQSVADDGQVLGVPTDVGGMAVSYRTDLFAAAGLPTDRDEVSALWSTWDEFIAVGREFVQATGVAFLDNSPTSVFYQAVNQVTMKYYDTDHNLVYEDNDEVRQAFELALRAIAAGITAKQTSFSDGWSAGMAKGDFAVVATPSWMLKTIKTNAPDTSGLWDVATIPGTYGNWGGSYLTIPARADNPQAAWDFIAAMQSPDSQLEMFLQSGSLPSTPSVYDDEQLLSVQDEFFSNAPIGQIFTNSLTGLSPFYIGPDSGTIGGEFQNALTSVEQGEADASEAWDTALKNIKNALGL